MPDSVEMPAPVNTTMRARVGDQPGEVGAESWATWTDLHPKAAGCASAR